MATPNVPAALTTEELKAALPDKVKKSINQVLVDKINTTLSDPELFENYRDNLLSYGRIMAEGRFKVENYVNAVKYVVHKIAGRTNMDAYALTFPDKIQRFTLQNVVPKDIASYVTAYSKSKLVVLLQEQSMIPFWLVNQDNRQKALNLQVELMLDTAVSHKVRAEAANSVLTHTKAPEAQQVELNITTGEDSTIAQLRRATLKLVDQQREAIKDGTVDAEEVAHSPITIEGEVIDETE